MKKTSLFALFILISGLYTALMSQSKSVLFLGNSYTFYNSGLPQMLDNIASSLGDDIEFESNTPGGYTLQAHSTNATSLDLIASRDWDFVVLQDQSQRPSFHPSQVAVEVYPYAQILCDSIYSNSSCTKPLFFMTWGYRNGDQMNCAAYPPICTYEGQQWRLRQSYVEMAETHNGWAVPCGMAFKIIRDSYPEIDLYTSDNSHPSIFGTYLAACTFYSSIFHKSPVGAYIPDGISSTDANILQTAAWNVVIDSLQTWLIDTTTIMVDFEPIFTTKSVAAYFENATQNSDSCLWDFGDGNTMMQYPGTNSAYELMQHTYSEEAEYEICLTGYKNCESVKVCKHRYIYTSNLHQMETLNFEIYPNPAPQNGTLYIENAQENHCSIYSVDGKLLRIIEIEDNRISLAGFNSGFYILICGDSKQKFTVN